MNIKSPIKRAISALRSLLGRSPVFVQGASVEWERLTQESIEFYRTENYEAAMTVAKQSLQIAEKNVGSEHLNVATSLNNLAELYRTQGHYAQAEPLYQRSLAIWEKALGADHPDVATGLNNLALLYDEQGQYAQAEPLYQRSLAILEKTLGSDHPNVVTSLENLAEFYKQTDRAALAESLERRAKAINANDFLSIADLPETEEEQLWQAVYDARQSYYEENIGSMPDYLLKMNDMSGVWPGGGIVNIKADKLGKDLWVYSTFGLSNADMPPKVAVEDYQAETDELGRVTKSTAMLKRKETVNTGSGGAGYGYEMLLITRENAEQPLEKNQWPLWFMQWVVHAEINNDAGFLNRVEKHDGYTVEHIKVGEAEFVNVLIAKARSPLPTETMLPNGNMKLLVATVITEDEMRWSIKHGRGKLLDKLVAAGVGQVSARARDSVLGDSL